MYMNSTYLVRMGGMMIRNIHSTLSDHQSGQVVNYYRFEIPYSTESFKVESQ